MLNRLPFVVLHTTSFIKLVVSGKVVEHLLVSIPRTFKQRVLSLVVFDLQGLVLIGIEQFQQLHILDLSSHKDWRLTLEVG